MGLLATRASRRSGAPHPHSCRWDGGREDVTAPTVELGEVHPLSQVFSKPSVLQTRVSNYSPIKYKDLTGEGAAYRPTTGSPTREAFATYCIQNLGLTAAINIQDFMCDECHRRIKQ